MSKIFVIGDEGVKKLRRLSAKQIVCGWGLKKNWQIIARCPEGLKFGGDGVGGESLLYPHKNFGGLKVKNAKFQEVLCSGGV